MNSGFWPWDSSFSSELSAINVYRNDIERFVDITATSNLQSSFYGMGIAVGDIDQDNDTDLFVTAVGANHLYRNDGDHFTNISQEMGVGGDDDAWSTSAAFDSRQ